MPIWQWIQSIVELILVGFTIWCLFNEDKLAELEDRIGLRKWLNKCKKFLKKIFL